MQAKKYPIKNWAEDDRPREKLLRKSPGTLSDAELLAILLNKGVRGQSAVDLGRDIMRMAQNDLNNLYKVTVEDLIKFPGIGLAKAITIVAALELGRRRHATEIRQQQPCFTHSRDAAAYLRTLFRDMDMEIFAVLYLNQANHMIDYSIIGSGGITSVIADPRLIFRKAMHEHAVHILLCHNHPSGDLTPSQADLNLTKQMKAAGELLEIKLLDHIIVSEHGYYSFADENKL